jgi:D-hexose-6-phosphate mutarotase
VVRRSGRVRGSLYGWEDNVVKFEVTINSDTVTARQVNQALESYFYFVDEVNEVTVKELDT